MFWRLSNAACRRSAVTQQFIRSSSTSCCRTPHGIPVRWHRWAGRWCRSAPGGNRALSDLCGPSTLTATAGLAQSRRGQATDDQDELDISVYFKPADLKIVGVTGTATTVDLTYQLAPVLRTWRMIPSQRLSLMDFDPGAGVQTLTRVGANDGYLLHLTQAAGDFVRVDQCAGGGAVVRISTISKQPGASRFAIGGRVSGTADFDPGAGVQLRANFESFDGFYVALDMPATFLHGGLTGGTGTDLIKGVAMASDGITWMSGYFQGSADLNPTSGTTSLTANGGFDAFYCGVSLAGVYVGNRWWGGTTNDYAKAIALTPAGAVRISGNFTGTVDFDPGGGIVNRSRAGASDAYLLGLQSNLTW